MQQPQPQRQRQPPTTTTTTGQGTGGSNRIKRRTEEKWEGRSGSEAAWTDLQHVPKEVSDVGFCGQDQDWAQ